MLIGWGLLLLISLVLAMSTFLPHTPQEMIGFADGSGAVFLDVLFKIGVYDGETFKLTLADTLWFKILVVLVVLFLVKALIKLSRQFYSVKNLNKSNLQFRFSYAGEEAEVRSFLLYSLRELGYKANLESKTITAFRGKVFNFSLLLIHFSLLITLIGGIYSYSTFEKGSLYLPQGVKVSSEQIEGIKGDESLELKADALWPQYYSVDEFGGVYNGLIKDYFANLKVYSSKEETSVVTTTSQSKNIDQFRFFLTDFGATGILAIKDNAGKEFTDVFPIQYQQGYLAGSYISKDNIGISINYSGMPGEDGKEYFSYSIYEYIDKGWQKTLEGKQELFKPIVYKDKEYIFKDINRVAQFTVVKTTSTLLHVGIISVLIGMTLFLYARRIKLRFNFDLPGQIIIEGSGLPDNLYMRQQLEKLSEKMYWEEI